MFSGQVLKSATFSIRLFQIGAAAVYINIAFRMTAEMWPEDEEDKPVREGEASVGGEAAESIS